MMMSVVDNRIKEWTSLIQCQHLNQTASSRVPEFNEWHEFELCKQERQVNMHTTRKAARWLSLDCKNKTKTAKIRCIQQFAKNGLSHRALNHVALNDQKETEESCQHHDDEQGCWNGSEWLDQHGSDVNTIFLPLFMYPRRQGRKDCPCPCLHYRHKISNACCDSNSQWKFATSYADFQEADKCENRHQRVSDMSQRLCWCLPAKSMDGWNHHDFVDRSAFHNAEEHKQPCHCAIAHTQCLLGAHNKKHCELHPLI